MKTIKILQKVVKMHRNKNNTFLKNYKMIRFSAENFAKAKIHIRTISNRRLFWVRMTDV